MLLQKFFKKKSQFIIARFYYINNLCYKQTEIEITLKIPFHIVYKYFMLHLWRVLFRMNHSNDVNKKLH